MDNRFIMALPLICSLSCLADGPGTTGGTMNVQGESLVLAKTEPGNLCFDQVEKGSLTLRSTFVPGKQGGIVYAVSQSIA